MNTPTPDAMTDFLFALDGLGPHMEAVGKLCCAAVEHRRWGTSMGLSIHNLTREEFDSHDGRETHYPITDERPREWWSKEVEVWKGDFDFDREPRVEGRIWLTLYTDEPPFEDDANEGLDFIPDMTNGVAEKPSLFEDALRLRELSERQTLTRQENHELAAIADRIHAAGVRLDQVSNWDVEGMSRVV